MSRVVAQVRQVLGELFGRRWRWMTLAALLMCAVTIGLGFWQLDRLAGRRALNAHLARRLTTPPVPLGPSGVAGDPQLGDLGAPAALQALEFRRVVVRGTFDYSREVALVNQVWRGELGVHLLTPLVFPGNERAVMVDRGWVPAEPGTGAGGALALDPAAWAQYRPGGAAVQSGRPDRPDEVAGYVRLSQRGRSAGVRAVTAYDVPAMQEQTGYDLLPLVVVQAPSPARGAPGAGPPYRQIPAPDLGDGVHLIAAVQWFVISGIILVGQVAFVWRHRSGQPGKPGERGQPGRPGPAGEAARSGGPARPPEPPESPGRPGAGPNDRLGRV